LYILLFINFYDDDVKFFIRSGKFVWFLYHSQKDYYVIESLKGKIFSKFWKKNPIIFHFRFCCIPLLCISDNYDHHHPSNYFFSMTLALVLSKKISSKQMKREENLEEWKSQESIQYKDIVNLISIRHSIHINLLYQLFSELLFQIGDFSS